MPAFLDVINVVGVLGATLISTVTLFTTRSLQRSQQKATMMANKRSERIDLMREYSAEIISLGKHIVFGVDSSDTKAQLIRYVDRFNSLLQYEYIHDVEMIDTANAIVSACLADTVDKSRLASVLDKFWKMCDVYVGVEYERLKVESMGDINGSGEVSNETKTFEDIYSIIARQQCEMISDKTDKQNDLTRSEGSPD